MPSSDVAVQRGDALAMYASWPQPVCIISDGAYGIGGFRGDPTTELALPGWYEPHVAAWSRWSSPQTTLWFWNTEVGWATVHPTLVRCGWEYVSLNVWDKGVGHVAGNVNSKTLRRFPVATEVCAHYIRPPVFQKRPQDAPQSFQAWLRSEWMRTGLPWHDANKACGAASAATRKWLTGDALWYPPPPDKAADLAKYANEHGKPDGRPYFSLNGMSAATVREWELLRPKFRLPIGKTNVWHEPHLRPAERFKVGGKSLHGNQKPLSLMRMLVEVSTDPGDVVWEPFGGLCSAAAACVETGRICRSAEIDPEVFRVASARLTEPRMLVGSSGQPSPRDV